MARIFQRLTPQTAANPVKLVIEWQKVIERLEEEIARIGATTADLTFNNSGAGGASGTVFNGGTAKTVSYNTVGASASGHNHDADYADIAHNHDADYADIAHTHALDDMSDVDLTGAATGDVLTKDASGDWVAAPPPGGGSGISDGDYGDISVSGGGAALTIDNDVVTFAKMQNVSTDKLLGRDTAASGDVEEIGLGQGLAFDGSGNVKVSVNRSFTDTLVNASGTTTIPMDNTIPQITEGTEALSLSITPTSTTARIRVHIVLEAQTSSASNWITVALFVNGGSNAVRANTQWQPTATANATITIVYEYVPGATTAQTLSVRGGLNSAGTITFNSAGGQSLGGVIKSSMTAWEVA